MSVQLSSLVVLAAIATDIVFGAICGDKSIDTIDLNSTDTRYPLTNPIVITYKYRIAIVADLDEKSKDTNESSTWISYIKKGYLIYNTTSKDISIEWDDLVGKGDQLTTNLSENGRGAELSELTTYFADLITIDDKTGWVYLIRENNLLPWVKLYSGDGKTDTGLKGEWATVKDSKLYVGSHGTERRLANGEVDPSLMWVKTIDQSGKVQDLDWTSNFQKLLVAVRIKYPGYMVHEAVHWSDVHQRWFFLPRKSSKEAYNQLEDTKKATNVLLSATENFDDVKLVRVGEIVSNRGYSSFKFIPKTEDTIIIAISTEEEGDATATYIKAFTDNGNILLADIKVSDIKFEGLEFI